MARGVDVALGPLLQVAEVGDGAEVFVLWLELSTFVFTQQAGRFRVNEIALLPSSR